MTGRTQSLMFNQKYINVTSTIKWSSSLHLLEISYGTHIIEKPSKLIQWGQTLHRAKAKLLARDITYHSALSQMGMSKGQWSPLLLSEDSSGKATGLPIDGRGTGEQSKCAMYATWKQRSNLVQENIRTVVVRQGNCVCFYSTGSPFDLYLE